MRQTVRAETGVPVRALIAKLSGAAGKGARIWNGSPHEAATKAQSVSARNDVARETRGMQQWMRGDTARCEW
jgi:hypothetical protein